MPAELPREAEACRARFHHAVHLALLIAGILCDRHPDPYRRHEHGASSPESPSRPVFSLLDLLECDEKQYASRKDAINTVSRHSQYFRCADAVARTYADPSQKVLWYLISDSRTLERDALATFPDKVVITGLKQSHVEITTGSAAWKGVKGASDGFLRTVAESYIFAGQSRSWPPSRIEGTGLTSTPRLRRNGFSDPDAPEWVRENPSVFYFLTSRPPSYRSPSSVPMGSDLAERERGVDDPSVQPAHGSRVHEDRQEEEQGQTSTRAGLFARFIVSFLLELFFVVVVVSPRRELIGDERLGSRLKSFTEMAQNWSEPHNSLAVPGRHRNTC